jgi:hypothetical protein
MYERAASRVNAAARALHVVVQVDGLVGGCLLGTAERALSSTSIGG